MLSSPPPFPREGQAHGREDFLNGCAVLRLLEFLIDVKSGLIPIDFRVTLYTCV